ncbi:hypothetical protein SAMN05216327_1052 [Dyadobacter sp. SG02]|uniref:hypothetical protein n=1 Tax=Dyadobacter sp. SG02 TaxID=1855291 RepID=UPI0008D7EC06|nr:hypothetical protein [Dyadobacter sp. SG02]SEI96342.1 hypothetical protein SAMN05216327_1052 [Dyadobacter sp. SG02]
MEKPESLEEFYQYKFNWLPENLQHDIGHFNVFPMGENFMANPVPARYSDCCTTHED